MICNRWCLSIGQATCQLLIKILELQIYLQPLLVLSKRILNGFYVIGHQGRADFNRQASCLQKDIDTAVIFALVFDLAHAHRPNFTGGPKMGSTKRLQINTADADKSYPPRTN